MAIELEKGDVGRRETLSFRCTPTEAHLIRALAAARASTITDLLRDLVLGKVSETFRLVDERGG